PVGADLSRPTPRNFTAEFEGTFFDLTNSDMTNDQMMPAPAWSADGRTLYALAAQRGASRIFAVPTDTGADKQPPTITPGNIHTLDFSMDGSKNKAAILIEDPARVAEIFVCSTTSAGELS